MGTRGTNVVSISPSELSAGRVAVVALQARQISGGYRVRIELELRAGELVLRHGADFIYRDLRVCVNHALSATLERLNNKAWTYLPEEVKVTQPYPGPVADWVEKRKLELIEETVRRAKAALVVGS